MKPWEFVVDVVGSVEAIAEFGTVKVSWRFLTLKECTKEVSGRQRDCV